MDTVEKLSKYKQRLSDLKSDFESWRSHYIDLQSYIMPRKGRYLSNEGTDEDNDGSKVNSNIINATGTDSANILAACMQGGTTSPSRPWYRLTLADKDIAEERDVKSWLYEVRLRMLTVFSRSNFYEAMYNLYHDLGIFGTSAMIIEPDFNTVIRCVPLTAGEYYIDLDSSRRPNTLYRRFSLTVSQIVEKFGIDNVSNGVRSMWENKSLQERIMVVHAIQPRQLFDPNKSDKFNMPYESVYFEESSNGTKFLREGGYKAIPFIAPRWNVAGSDVYGRSPGMLALGDIKQLQKMEEKKLRALDKMVDPPMVGPSSLKKQGGGTIVSGGMNYVDAIQGQQGFGPAYQVNPNVRDLAFDIERTEQRIKRFFYVDLFISILNESKTMTAREVIERSNEKMLLLGPVIEKIQTEGLNIAIERTFNIMNDFNMIPDPPSNLNIDDLKIEYIGLLAQAQRATAVTAIEQLLGFVGSAAALDQTALDKIDVDEAIERYSLLIDADPDIVRSEDEADEIRKIKQQQIEAAQAMQTGQAMADTAETLSKAKVEDNNVLNMLMQMR